MATQTLKGWLDWQLKHGSHEFPGPDGGTCVNEAALVVAGFAYREVTSISDLPESFCPVVSQYALTLNDSMPEGALLNRLRPFAARLCGSSDSRKVAVVRSSHLAMQAATVFAPMAIEPVDAEAAAHLRAATTQEDALATLKSLGSDHWPEDVRAAAGAAYRALERTMSGKGPIYTAELAAICATRAAAVDANAWDEAIRALDGILAIGKQADPIETSLIEEHAQEYLAIA